jgi:hypothetical protein
VGLRVLGGKVGTTRFSRVGVFIGFFKKTQSL